MDERGEVNRCSWGERHGKELGNKMCWHLFLTHKKIQEKNSFNGNANSRNVLLSEACCQAKRWNLLRNPVEPDLAAQTFSGDFSRPVEPDLSPKASRNLLRNLLRNPVEPDLALHQSLPNLQNLLRNPVEPDLSPKASRNLLRNLFRNPVEPNLAPHQSLPDLRNLLQNPVELDLALHQSLPDLLRNFSGPDLALHQSLPDLHRNLVWNLT